MKKTAAAAAIIFALIVLLSCSKADMPGENATVSSDSDASKTGQTVVSAEEQLKIFGKAEEVTDGKAFGEALKNPDIPAIKYTSDRDITVKSAEKISKPLSLASHGKIRLKCETAVLELRQAEKGFISNAEAEMLIISGENITAEIKNGAGMIYITGKGSSLHIYGGEIRKILAINSSAVIMNHTAEPVEITLANGAKTTLEAKHTYFLKDNLVKEGVKNP